MRRLATFALIAASLTACAPYEPEPVSAWQWQQRQERIERQEAERLRRCQMGETGVERDDRRCRDGVPR